MTREEIRNLIEEEGIEFIRLQFTDIFGNLKNIAVTSTQLDKVLDNRFAFKSSALLGDGNDCDQELYLKPDIESFVILPWRPQQGKVAKFLCDIYCEDGSIYELNPREILRKVVGDAVSKGYDFIVDPECEFFLFHTDEDGNPTTVTHERAGYLDVGPMDYGENARRDIVLNLEEMGFDVESSHHEKAPAQHEIDFGEAEALKIADSIMTFKFAVRSIAKRFGLYATFMPKPKSDVAGSGMHLNISLYKDDRNLFNKDTKNFIAGIKKHIRAIASITNPIVNSYKRILSGTDITDENLFKVRNTAQGVKIELRFPDASANPYLALAVCIAAGIEGVENELDGKIEEVKFPGTLKGAVDALYNDEFITNVLGKEFVNIYGQAKMDEWNEYMKQVSDWEIEKYLYKM